MSKQFLWLISQDTNHDYDTYGDAVVVAPDPDTAKTIHPRRMPRSHMSMYQWDAEEEVWRDPELGICDGWLEEGVTPDYVTVLCVGEADPAFRPGSVNCASYRAG